MPWHAYILPDHGVSGLIMFPSADWGVDMPPSYVPGANWVNMDNSYANTEYSWLRFSRISSTEVADRTTFDSYAVDQIYPFAEFKVYFMQNDEPVWNGTYVFVGLKFTRNYGDMISVRPCYGKTNALHEVTDSVEIGIDLFLKGTVNPVNCGYCEVNDGEYTYACFCFADYVPDYVQQYRSAFWGLRMDNFGGMLTASQFTKFKKRDDPNEDDDGNSEEGGGGGSHDHEGDIVREGDIDDLITVTGGGCGFITYYKITQAQLATLASEMFNTTFWDAVKNFFEKPIEIVSGVLLLPITPAGGASYHPKYGLFSMTLALPIVANQFKDVDFGSVYVDEYYSSAFDYSPYTSVSLFLPFIGVRDIDVDEVMGKWLHVKYRIDCYTGNCLAIVMVGNGTAGSDTVRYQFAGNCGQQIPIGGEDFSNVINGALTVATVAAASIVTAGAAGAAAGTAAANSGATIAETELVAQSAQAAANTKAAMDIGAAAVNQVMNAKPIVTRTGSMGCSMGMMGVLKPYLLKKVPRQSLPEGYKSFYGYPSNISGTIGSFSGYTVVDSVKLKGIPGTDSEIAEIENSLKGGVFV